MSRDLEPVVYLLASRRNGTLYVGVTSNLMQRIAHATMEHAILRKKQIKKWRRAWKLDLIEQGNPDWRDLAVDFGFEPLR